MMADMMSMMTPAAPAAAPKKAVKKRTVKKALKKRLVKKALKKRAVKKAIKRKVAKKAIKRKVVKKAVKRRVVKKALKKKAVKRRVVKKAVKRKVAKKAVKRKVAKKRLRRRSNTLRRGVRHLAVTDERRATPTCRPFCLAARDRVTTQRDFGRLRDSAGQSTVGYPRLRQSRSAQSASMLAVVAVAHRIPCAIADSITKMQNPRHEG